jgi:hypothetical protein
MTLYEFRSQFPGLKPGALVRHKGGPLLELVSWPYEGGPQDGASFVVYARIPGDATTAAVHDVRTLTVVQEGRPAVPPMDDDPFARAEAEDALLDPLTSPWPGDR